MALFTVTAGTAIAVSTYFRRQVDAINESMNAERVQGALRHRLIFVSNSHSIRHAFRNLLPTLRSLIADCEHVDTSRALTRLRERPSDLAVKQELWQQVKTASLTHLLTSVYMSALLYGFLTLQMNLLARYNVPGAERDARHGMQALPGGSLASPTSKRFLDLVLILVLDGSIVRQVAACVQRAVLQLTADFDLAHTPNVEEVDALLRSILMRAWEGTPSAPSGTTLAGDHIATNGHQIDDADKSRYDEGKSGNVHSESEGKCHSLRDTLRQSLFEDMAQQCSRGVNERIQNGANTRSFDANYAWLVCESLDLCEVLDFSQLVLSTAHVVTSFAVDRMRNDVENGINGKAQTFARLMARFSSMGSTVVTSREGDAGDDCDGGDGMQTEDVDQWLLWDQGIKDFGASVFVSGEKDGSSMSNGLTMDLPR